MIVPRRRALFGLLDGDGWAWASVKAFVWLIIISHFISVILSFLLVNQMVRITEIRSALILPGIILLVLFGGFSEDNSFFSMYVTVIAGFAGMLMIWLDWPRPPLVLGLVLGALIEKNLFISYSRYEFSFLLRPVLIGIMVVAVALIAAPYIQKRIAQRWRVREEYLATQES